MTRTTVQGNHVDQSEGILPLAFSVFQSEHCDAFSVKLCVCVCVCVCVLCMCVCVCACMCACIHEQGVEVSGSPTLWKGR